MPDPIHERPQVIAALREALVPFERPDGGIWAPSSTWIIRARNPG